MNADTRFAIAVIAVLCPVTFFAVWEWGAFGTLAIVLVPFAFIIRQHSLQNANDRNARRADAIDRTPPSVP